MPTNDPPTNDATVQASAWCGQQVAQGEWETGEAAGRWVSTPALTGDRQPLGAVPVDWANWRDPRVGWGLVVPDRDDVSPIERARGIDLSEPLQDLVRSRGDASILRWRSDVHEGRLRRYDANGKPADLLLTGARGSGGPSSIPYYLLIAASPKQIPWHVQYLLQADAFVGRIDLHDDALARYVDALMSDWSGCAAVQPGAPVIWAVDHGYPDISRLMRKVLADRLGNALSEDLQKEFTLDGGWLNDAQATGAGLIRALCERRPAFVMTSSHGATFPLDEPAALRRQIGLPVDHNHQPLDLKALSAWNPSGSIWYAHACCSAGTDADSSFRGVFTPDSSLAKMLEAVAGAGSLVAPLPQALLGAAQPARAFVGHVEPTFDWTLRDPVTGQSTTQSLIDCFYTRLHSQTRLPLGLALHAHQSSVTSLLLDHGHALQDINGHKAGATERARRSKLKAVDRLAMVLIGDPTVRVPATV